MAASILVGYATRYGSTQDVAEAVAATLREHGLDVDLAPMSKVRTLAGYRAVVLGAPIYFGRWHKDARRFLSLHQEALTQRPVAIFAIELFGGKYDPAKLHLLDRLIASLPASPFHNEPASDVRDWTAIRAWASNLAAKLQSDLLPQ